MVNTLELLKIIKKLEMQSFTQRLNHYTNCESLRSKDVGLELYGTPGTRKRRLGCFGGETLKM